MESNRIIILLVVSMSLHSCLFSVAVTKSLCELSAVPRTYGKQSELARRMIGTRDPASRLEHAEFCIWFNTPRSRVLARQILKEVSSQPADETAARQARYLLEKHKLLGINW